MKAQKLSKRILFVFKKSIIINDSNHQKATDPTNTTTSSTSTSGLLI
ncbi:hypothetical protein [Pedobacter rhizosphaerae]|uniref:Uncharacterized protein n=1 Tax=Pedobacter rhizosphaerae TaxID=390241 RepID=A0A1H9VKZ3_9SPHI|nr:hypothetical protein [Pedobacter rhizosphaerae]SES22198.1 hypothetical protein SAMN04488023_14428 [Pedobacter rhizosphaerae]